MIFILCDQNTKEKKDSRPVVRGSYAGRGGSYAGEMQANVPVDSAGHMREPQFY